MKRIEGLVCVGKTENGSVLFGRGVPDLSKPHENLKTNPYEDFQANGLSPYRIVSEAMQGLKEIKRLPEIKNVEIKKIRMHVAESELDLAVLKRSKSLIVVVYDGERVKFIEPRIGDSNGNPPPIELLYENGLTPFDSFEQAEKLASKLSRPPDYITALASFRLGRETEDEFSNIR